MRFSLKWILVAVVYVAVAAAAFSQQSWVYADILWAVSFLAVVFAAMMAFLAHGKSRIAAAGFLLASVCYLTCLAFGQISGSEVVPTRRWLMAAGYDPNVATINPIGAAGGASSYQNSAWVTYPLPSAYSLTATAGTLALAGSPQPVIPSPPTADFGMYVRAANAVGMMAFGGLGVIIGLFALKRVSQRKREA
jgi:hypothetical protein